jgi:hypothetical protein
LDWVATTVCGAAGDTGEPEESSAELFDLFDWARGRGLLEDSDISLLRDLLTASHAVADQETPWAARGVSSQAALGWLAERSGISSRTLRRRRDCVIQRLRSAVPEYLSDVA